MRQSGTKLRGFIRTTLRALLPVFVVFVVIPNANAQVSVVRPNSIEVGPFVGATFGFDKVRVMAGGNVTYAVTKRILPYIEYSYFPSIVRTSAAGRPPGSQTASGEVAVQDFHAGIHFRFPIHEFPVVPYAVVGLGALIYPDRFITFTSNVPGVIPDPPLPVDGAADFAVSFGGGLRYYRGQKWGMRFEGMMYKPTGTDFHTVFGKLEFGLFYQFR